VAKPGDEQWDVMQVVPEKSANNYTMIAAPIPGHDGGIRAKLPFV
jgi:hypothetical protein